MVFLVWIDNVVCMNSDSNQEENMEQYRYRLGSYQGKNRNIAQLFLVIVRNKQYWLYLWNKSNINKKFFDTGFTCDGTM